MQTCKHSSQGVAAQRLDVAVAKNETFGVGSSSRPRIQSARPGRRRRAIWGARIAGVEANALGEPGTIGGGIRGHELGRMARTL